MARINIEDTLWKDNRFQDLLIKTGNRHTAKGMVLELWIVAQKYWIASKGQGIPKPAWKSERLPDELIECGFAKDNGDFIYAVGSKDQFAWLNACSESGKKGGPAAAKARRETTGKSKRPKSSKHDGERRDTTSSSSSFSLSSSDSSSESKEQARAANAGAFIGTYCSVWKDRYGSRPDVTGKNQGIAKRLTHDLGTERASELVASYLKMNTAWFIQKRHDLATFEQNLTAVGQFHDTGQSVSTSEARQAELYDTNVQAAQEYMRRKHGSAPV